MSVVVPVNECVNVIFENSENMPEDFYINIMNLLKVYYDHKTNLDQIHEFLNKNKNKVDNLLMEKIKMSLCDFLPTPPPKIKIKRCDKLFDKLFLCTSILIIGSVPAVIILIIILNLTKVH
jgi:hypothetical protein